MQGVKIVQGHKRKERSSVDAGRCCSGHGWASFRRAFRKQQPLLKKSSLQRQETTTEKVLSHCHPSYLRSSCQVLQVMACEYTSSLNQATRWASTHNTMYNMSVGLRRLAIYLILLNVPNPPFKCRYQMAESSQKWALIIIHANTAVTDITVMTQTNHKVSDWWWELQNYVAWLHEDCRYCPILSFS